MNFSLQFVPVTLSSLKETILTAIVVFFAPLLPALIAVFILIVIDTVTGLVAAKKNQETITSKRFGGAITKLIVYHLLIVSAHLCEQFLFPQLPFIKIALGFLAITEFYSISENFEKATGKSLLKYIKTYMDRKFRGLLIDRPTVEQPKEEEPKQDFTL